MRILYIDVDSLRPDHLSCYGYLRRTSPYMDAVAAEGVRFTNFFTSDAPCLPSRTAFFSGMFGVRSGVVDHGGPYADWPLQGDGRGFRTEMSENTFASALRRSGYHTASISPFPNRHTAYQVWHGFNEMYDTGKGGLENGDEVYPVAKQWLEANGQKDNWFLHINFWDPHTPYDHPESFGNPFADEPIDPWITQAVIDAQNKSFGPHSSMEVPDYDDQMHPAARMGVGQIRSLADAKAHIDGYDTGICYTDHFIGKLVADLKALGIYEETAVIISADHGENQGELNVWGDHQTADQITNRLPLIMRWPGVTDSFAGQTQTGFHYHLDLPATIIDLIGGQSPDVWDGESFAETMVGADGRPFLVISQGAWSCQRSVRWDHWLLIRTYHTGLKHFPEFMLFDIGQDPHETTNLASTRRDIVGEGLLLLDQWMGQQMGRSLRGDPFWGIIRAGGPLHANVNSPHWETYLERLRTTGRAHHAAQLEKFGGRPFTSGLEGG